MFSANFTRAERAAFVIYALLLVAALFLAMATSWPMGAFLVVIYMVIDKSVAHWIDEVRQ